MLTGANAGVVAGPRGIPALPATHWRIVPLAAAGGRIRFGEIEMASSPGGADLTTGGTVIHSGFTQQDFAFDGNLANAFAAQDWLGVWIGYVFASPVLIKEVRIGQAVTPLAENMRAGVVQQSLDGGTTWRTVQWICDTTAWTVVGSSRSYAVGSSVIPNSRGLARAWRILATENVGAAVNTYECGEIAFASTASGASVLTGGVPLHSCEIATAFGSDILNCFDGLTGASSGLMRTSGLSSARDFAFGYVFPTTAPVVAEARWTCTTSNAPDLPRLPRDGLIQWSSNGATWNTAGSFAGGGAWTNGETRAWAVSP